MRREESRGDTVRVFLLIHGGTHPGERRGTKYWRGKENISVGMIWQFLASVKVLHIIDHDTCPGALFLAR